MGMNKKDLARIIGYKIRVSEIFSRKRKLSLRWSGIYTENWTSFINHW